MSKIYQIADQIRSELISDVTQELSNERYDYIIKSLKDLTCNNIRLSIIADIINVSNLLTTQENKSQTLIYIYQIHNSALKGETHKEMIDKYDVFNKKFPNLFQAIINKIPEDELIKYMSAANDVASNEASIKKRSFEDLSYVRKRVKLNLDKKHEKFIKKYPRLYGLIFDNVDMEVAKKMIDIAEKLNNGELSDKDAAYQYALQSSRSYFPDNVLRDEGLLDEK